MKKIFSIFSILLISAQALAMEAEYISGIMTRKHYLTCMQLQYVGLECGFKKIGTENNYHKLYALIKKIESKKAVARSRYPNTNIRDYLQDVTDNAFYDVVIYPKESSLSPDTLMMLGIFKALSKKSCANCSGNKYPCIHHLASARREALLDALETSIRKND